MQSVFRQRTPPPEACYSLNAGGVYCIAASRSAALWLLDVILTSCYFRSVLRFMRHIKLYERHQVKTYHRQAALLHPQNFFFFLHTQEVACQMECFPDLFPSRLGKAHQKRPRKKKKSWEVAHINRFDVKQYFLLLPVEPVSNWLRVSKQCARLLNAPAPSHDYPQCTVFNQPSRK